MNDFKYAKINMYKTIIIVYVWAFLNITFNIDVQMFNY